MTHDVKQHKKEGGEDTVALGSKLRQLRNAKGVTQKEVAKAIEVSERTYIAYELDERMPRTKSKYERLAEFYGVPVEYLYGQETEYDNIEVAKSILKERVEFDARVDRIIMEVLESEGWFVKRNQKERFGNITAFRPSTGESLVVKVSCFLASKVSKILFSGDLYKIYGEIAAIKATEVKLEHVLLVTNLQELISMAKVKPPVNLKLKITARLIDLKAESLGDYVTLVN